MAFFYLKKFLLTSSQNTATVKNRNFQEVHMNSGPTFQDYFPGNLCFGCGPANKKGLHIKSRWYKESEGETMCGWRPSPHHSAGIREVMHGGIVGSLIDCHSIWTAIANDYRITKRTFGSLPVIWYVTRHIEVDLIKPTPMDTMVYVWGKVVEASGKKRIVEARLFAHQEERARGMVVAIQKNWDHTTIRKLLHHDTAQ